jgi:hypothetical protein
MKRFALSLALLALVLNVASLAQAVDRFALIKVVNTSPLPLTFGVQIGNAPWQRIDLQPGESRGIYANFSAPGSYRHDTIRFGFDQDLGPAFNNREITPFVKYSPDIDFNRAQLYHFGFDGNTGRYCEMFHIN